MQISGMSAVVTGGASGLGRASVALLRERGARLTFCDLPRSQGEAVAQQLGARFVAGDVTDTAQMNAVLDAAAADGPLRAVVHCAGRGGAVRLVERDGSPGSLETFEAIIKLNLIGSFNVLRLAAARMATADPVGEERGVLIMTASVAAYEGQIGQIPYSASKAGVVGMTVVAARDLASKLIRVCTIAPGIFDTPMLARLNEEIRASLGRSVPNPARLGKPEEFAQLALHIIENPMLNGETIRLDGALRMAPR